MKLLHTIKKNIKQETVLVFSIILAVISSFIVHPDDKYISYIDWNTIMLLFCLMTVMAGFKQLGVFRVIGMKLLSHTKNTRQLSLVLIFLPFVLSMFITNDVSLITFVPFAIIVLKMADKEKLIIPIVTLQTIAANLGSMLMPMGNPQNLYLYASSHMHFSDFISLMLPYTLISALCLFLSLLLIKRKQITKLDIEAPHINKKYILLFCVEFILCLLSVADVLDIRILTIIIIVITIIFNRSLFKQVDYSLLLTFIAFFVFIGNMGRITEFKNFIENILNGHEVLVSILSSQIISNVPTALLLSGFTDNWNLLIIGTNIGGLGTLIASMASLISYKQIAKEMPDNKMKYLGIFTLCNIIMLLILMFAHSLLT